MYIRAIQGHSGGALVDPELLNYVCASTWMERVKKDGRLVFFTAPDPLGDELDEEYEDLIEPRKIHDKSKWRVTQDAIYWINMRKEQLSAS